MRIEERILGLNKLGKYFLDISHEIVKDLDSLTESHPFYLVNQRIQLAGQKNAWFTQESIQSQLKYWGDLLKKDQLEAWIESYNFHAKNRTIGIIMAGNLPLVGFHDLVSVLLSGSSAKIKLSSKDEVLMKWVIETLFGFDFRFQDIIIPVEKIKDINALIATGSNNTARYFEYYFRDIPKILRKNRTSVAVLTGNEIPEELSLLGKDIFQYFGLGCRNVTQLLVPENYSFDAFFEAIYDYQNIINHNKYANNYSYNRTVFLMNQDLFLDNNFLLLKKSNAIYSPISSVNYDFYSHEKAAKRFVESNQEKIQCVVSLLNWNLPNQVKVGESQSPKLTDYADNVDTLAFLKDLS